MARITSNVSKYNKCRWVILHKWQSLNFVEKYIKSQQYIVYKFKLIMRFINLW